MNRSSMSIQSIPLFNDFFQVYQFPVVIKSFQDDAESVRHITVIKWYTDSSISSAGFQIGIPV